MRLDLATIAADRTPLDLELAAEALDVPPEDFALVGPLHFTGDLVRRAAGEYVVSGRLHGTLSVPCSRCLEPFAVPLAATFDLQYAPAALVEAQDEHEIGQDDLAVEFYRDETIDLGVLAREQCYLALPMKPLCHETCRGLCPQCGVNLNLTTCACDARWVDPRLEGLKALVRGPESE
jgi:uncharacterized protein